MAQACKSGGLEIPDGPFVLVADDLENRVFHFSVSHEEFNGIKRAAVRFHAESYALQIDPSLENVSFPNEAPRGVHLRSATQPSPEAVGGVAPKEPAPTPPSAPEATELPAEGLETLTDAEFAEALAYAKKLREKKD